MRLNIISTRTVLLAVFTGFTLSVSAAILFYFFPNASIQSGSAQALEDTAGLSPQASASYGLPVHIKIPAINVDAAVESVGLAPDGSMDVPKDPSDAAWFNLGPRPGDVGSAIIDGHYGPWKNGKLSVFDDLHTLRKGDTISVQDDAGTTISFVVRKIQRFDPNANDSDVFGSNDGQVHLNLITCDGVWDKTAKQYSQRLVIFADKTAD